MAPTYIFPCGCSFPILEENPPEGCIPLLDFAIEEVPLTCPAVWQLLGEGGTLGTFQLEKKLGQEWSRKQKPESMDHLAALTALLRPGCLNSRDENGVSMTEHYCKRKNGEEPLDNVNEHLKPILGETYNVLTYQEQFMRIARDLAGFDLNMVEKLRKNISKKRLDLLHELETAFLEGCARVGKLASDVAAMVWSWIMAAGKYAFCAAHAVTYAILSFYTAYAKAHLPLPFYTAWLACSHLTKGKQREEIALLVEDARLRNIRVFPPDARRPEPHFYTDRRNVFFGLGDVKKVGASKVEALRAGIESAQYALGKPVSTFTWFEFLTRVLFSVSSDVAQNLIAVGSCDWSGLTRSRMQAEYQAWRELTDGELAWVFSAIDADRDARSIADIALNITANEEAITALKSREDLSEDERQELEDGQATVKEEKQRLFHKQTGTPRIDSVESALEAAARPIYRKPKTKKDQESAGPFGTARNENRANVLSGKLATLRNPPSPLVDSPRRIVLDEEDLLGVPLTADRLDQCDLAEANTTVAEALAGKQGRLLLGLEVTRVKPTTTKKGKKPGSKMAQLTLRDRTGSVESVIFPEEFAQFGPLFRPQALLLIHAELDKRSQTPSLVVKGAWAAR